MIINKTFIKYILHILLKYDIIQDQYVPVVWLLSCVQLFVTPRTPLSFTISQSLLKCMPWSR